MQTNSLTDLCVEMIPGSCADSDGVDSAPPPPTQSPTHMQLLTTYLTQIWCALLPDSCVEMVQSAHEDSRHVDTRR